MQNTIANIISSGLVLTSCALVCYAYRDLWAMKSETAGLESKSAALERKNAALEKENAALDRKIALTRAEMQLLLLSSADAPPRTISSFTVRAARDTHRAVGNNEALPLEEVRALLADFHSRRNHNHCSNSSSSTAVTERGPRTAHDLWRKILCLVARKYRGSRDAAGTREEACVVQDWPAEHPKDLSPLSVDYAFFSDRDAVRIGWTQLRGGLAVTDDDDNDNNREVVSRKRTRNGYPLFRVRESESESTQAKPRAIVCAALRAWAHWRAANQIGAHAAFCCFADTRRLGVVRVCITEDCEVIVEETKPMRIASEDGEALHLLFSPAETLAAQGLCSILTTAANEQLTHIEGWDENKANKLSWRVCSRIGCGGTSDVFVEASPSPSPSPSPLSSQCLIKQVRYKHLKYYLRDERDVLKALWERAPTATCFPALVDTLYDENGEVEALKLTQRGIPLAEYIQPLKDAGITAHTKNRLVAVLRVVGPAVVRALQCAHACGVSHNDVRLPNILLVPHAEDVLRRIVAWREDVTAHDETAAALFEGIDLRQCRVVLNDWDCASLKGDEWFSEDLLSAAKELCAAVRVTEAAKELVFSRNYLKKLSRCAQNKEYDQMCVLLEQAVLVERVLHARRENRYRRKHAESIE